MLIPYLTNRKNSCHCRSDEHEKDEDSFQGIDLASSITSRTFVDLKLSLCKSSITSGLGRNYIPSAIATDAAAAGGSTGNDPPVGAEVSLRTTQSLQQIHHETEVVTVDVEVPTVESVARTGYESEQASSVNSEEEEAKFVRKCTRWFCMMHGKSAFEMALLSFCYLIIGVLLFPFTLVILMVCCISYFTPGIDD